MNTSAIENATNKSWSEWLEFFEQINAKALSHKEIAQKVYESGTPAWWSQNVTVAYEQHIGRRLPGQDSDGEFNVAVTRTLDGTMDQMLEKWQNLVKDREDFVGIAISRGPDTSKTDKWRYWRCGLADGSRLNVSIYHKSPGKASLSISHEKLESADQAEHWRTYWKEFLTRI